MALPPIAQMQTTTYLVTLDVTCKSGQPGTYPFVVIPGTSFLMELKRVIQADEPGQAEAAQILLDFLLSRDTPPNLTDEESSVVD